MLDPSQISIRESALLVIDAQDSFKATSRWERRNNLDFERNVGMLIDAYRTANLPVIFFLHTDPDPHFDRDSPSLKLMDFIQRRPEEPLIVKNTRNCFTSTGLGALLLSRGVRRIAITGIQTEQCCETTTRVAADLGYAVDFVTEATLTFPIPNHDAPGEELAPDAICERTEYALRRRFARISTVAGLAQELANTAAGAVARCSSIFRPAKCWISQARCRLCTRRTPSRTAPTRSCIAASANQPRRRRVWYLAL